MAELADQHQTLTFVVRLWLERDACGQEHWRGRVEHVGTQQVCYVDDVAAVVDVMARWAGEPDVTEGQLKEKKEV